LFFVVVIVGFFLVLQDGENKRELLDGLRLIVGQGCMMLELT
jgi:hypothetical protein